jgi:hypothetical protein
LTRPGKVFKVTAAHGFGNPRLCDLVYEEHFVAS